MGHSIKPFNILIDIDVILDCRLSALSSNGKDPEKELLADKDTLSRYINRESDKDIPAIFKDVSKEEFEKWSSVWDVKRLTTASITAYSYIISSIIKEVTAKQDINMMADMPFVLTVNTFPYRMNPDNANIFMDAVKHNNKGLEDIIVISKDHSEMTLEHIHTSYSAYILYDFQKFLFRIDSEIMEVNSYLLNVLAPKLRCGDDDIAGMKNRNDDQLDPYQAMKEFLAPAMALDFLPPRFFSYPPDTIK